jgi:hypothetical protein
MIDLRKINVKKTVSWAGSALMLLSLLFIARQVYEMRNGLDFSVLTNPLVIAAFIAVVVFEGLVMVLNALNYHGIIADITGLPIKKQQVVKTYTVANLYKYIPGGIMYVVGRNRLAVENDELSHGKVALATVIEGVLWAVSGAVIAASYSFRHSLHYIRQYRILPFILIAIAVIALILTPIIYIFRRRITAAYTAFKTAAPELRIGKTSAKRLLYMLVLMNLWAVTFIAVLMLLGQAMTPALTITVMGLYILSWTAGFLTPGAPSGLGIREAVLLMFMSGTLNESVLLSTIVIHRALQVAGDLAAYVMVWVYSRYARKGDTLNEVH